MSKNFLFFFLLVQSLYTSPHAVTYEFSGGRFGDNLLSYLHAKWLSYLYDIPLLYKPFKYSSDLTLHDREREMKMSEYRSRYKVGVNTIEKDLQHSHPLLFVCPYFPEDPFEREAEKEMMDYHSCFDVDWQDEGFRKIAREMITPKKKLKLIDPPKETINIAFHVRLGEGYDAEDMKIRFPLKLPPMSFYCEALKKVLEQLKGKKVYCHIFTDSLFPDRLMETFESLIPKEQEVQFDCRKGWNRFDVNVLDDFFSFFSFDILIRSQSNFSVISSCLHDFALVCFPSFYSMEKGVPKIEKIEMKFHEALFQQLMKEK